MNCRPPTRRTTAVYAAAPHIVVNGHTAIDAYYRTHPSEELTR